ncbi:hypothetical protein BD779DRAFT_1675371 [Infundibulicybe gibba]|nr:hypothetical protein BD779DRAFT_1675371 [Infundibulicybe gibba]
MSHEHGLDHPHDNTTNPSGRIEAASEGPSTRQRLVSISTEQPFIHGGEDIREHSTSQRDSFPRGEHTSTHISDQHPPTRPESPEYSPSHSQTAHYTSDPTSSGAYHLGEQREALAAHNAGIVNVPPVQYPISAVSIGHGVTFPGHVGNPMVAPANPFVMHSHVNQPSTQRSLFQAGMAQLSAVRPRQDQPAANPPLLGFSTAAQDWIVPVEEKLPQRTIGDRLEPTLLTAIAEKDKYAFKAKMTGYALNAAIGLQVLLGALTTGLSAVTTGRQTSIMTAILGGLATIVASYLARARGSNEPELSITRVKDLEQFIRECQAFQMDYGLMVDGVHDHELETLRRRFEELLGNANGERKLSPPV